MKSIIENLTNITNFTNLNLNDVIKALKKELKKFKDKHKASMNEVFKFSPKIMMNLLLNFESFDDTTSTKDVYMPEEKIVNFNVGFIKLNFKGKLRLTQDRQKPSYMKNKVVEGTPQGTYGVIEDKDLFIKFDKPVLIKYLYIRPHSVRKENKFKSVEMNVVGFLNEKAQFSTKMYLMPNNGEWYKVVPSQQVIDILKLPKDFDVDDISIAHDSDFAGGAPEDNEQLTSILQNVIDELIEQTNKKADPVDDL